MSEDVEKAAEEYAGSNYVKNHLPKSWKERNLAFRAGAEWQKQQDALSQQNTKTVLKELDWLRIIFNEAKEYGAGNVILGRIKEWRKMSQQLSPISDAVEFKPISHAEITKMALEKYGSEESPENIQRHEDYISGAIDLLNKIISNIKSESAPINIDEDDDEECRILGVFRE